MTELPTGIDMIEERDVMVAMRDGVRLAVDVYRPRAQGKFPVLYACALHNKDMQGPDMSDVLPPQPAYSPLWFGPIEAGDTRRFLAAGYIHVIAQSRGTAKSEGQFLDEQWDHYDLIEWISKQVWCDGNIGMVGISAYAGEQWRAAAQQHPALKAIFPYDACGAYGGMFGFRDFYPGGLLHAFPYLLDVFSTVHESRGIPGELSPEQEGLWKRAMQNPDYKMYANLYNVVTQKGERTGLMYGALVQPWEEAGAVRAVEETFNEIKCRSIQAPAPMPYLQAAPARRAALLPKHQTAAQAAIYRRPISNVPSTRSMTTLLLVRPLAEGQRQRHHG